MQKKRIVVPAILFVAAVSLSGCGQPGGLFERIGNFGGQIFGTGDGANQQTFVTPQNATAGTPPPIRILPNEGSRGFLGFGRNAADPGPQVNAFLWAAALDVLGYLPIQGADPVSGRFSTGYGTAPGSSRAYRADVHIDGPVLDASTLKLALYTRSGAASAAVTQTVYDAILDRARQLRVAAR
jgi:hypothetical protein